MMHDHHRVLRVFATALLAAWINASLVAQVQPMWTNVSPGSGPSARSGHAMSYDSLRNVTVLFGGYSGGNETWEWDGFSWAQVATPGPSPRSQHATVYDSLRGVTVLFGGNVPSTGYIRDTWEWDGSSWTQVAITGPSARYDHAMAYDSQRARIVLFGGRDVYGYSSQTWEWYAGAWQPLPFVSGPSARDHHAMAYDSQRGVTVLFGGFSHVQGFLGDTWEWDGTSWTQVATSGPNSRSDHAMIYDATSAGTVLFGGRDINGSYLGDTWVWDGSSWSNVTPSTGPSSRFDHAMAYDSLRGKAMLFGGYNNGFFGDTWEFDPQNLASALPYGTGCGSPVLDLTPQANARPVIGTVGRAALTNVPSQPGISFVALGWSRTTSGGFALPLSLAGFGMPGCDLLTSAEAAAVPTTPTGAGTANVNLAVPNNSGLIGLEVYLQGWAVAPGVNPGNTIVSNGVSWLIGNT